jgi:hypothetical protein
LRRRWPKVRGAARRRIARSRSLRTRRPDGHARLRRVGEMVRSVTVQTE